MKHLTPRKHTGGIRGHFRRHQNKYGIALSIVPFAALPWLIRRERIFRKAMDDLYKNRAKMQAKINHDNDFKELVEIEQRQLAMVRKQLDPLKKRLNNILIDDGQTHLLVKGNKGSKGASK